MTVTNNTIDTTKTSPKMPKKRCGHIECKKKLSMVEREFVCVCGKCFCIKHRLPEFHECRHDFVETEKTKKEKSESLRCVANKVIKI